MKIENFHNEGMATDNQKEYIHVLIAELLDEGINVDIPSDEEIEDLLIEEASDLIDNLKDILGWS